jgi:flagellar biogenesis protein FliO
MSHTKLSQVFQIFQALHVGSHEDVVVIQQGDATITLPAALIHELIEALRLASQGEL